MEKCPKDSEAYEYFRFLRKKRRCPKSVATRTELNCWSVTAFAKEFRGPMGNVSKEDPVQYCRGVACALFCGNRIVRLCRPRAEEKLFDEVLTVQADFRTLLREDCFEAEYHMQCSGESLMDCSPGPHRDCHVLRDFLDCAEGRVVNCLRDANAKLAFVAKRLVYKIRNVERTSQGRQVVSRRTWPWSWKTIGRN